MSVAEFNRTLDQELLALRRAVSLECLVCSEFVLIRNGQVTCPECGTSLRGEIASEETQLHFGLQAG